MTVDVYVLSYNREHLIEQTLKSLLSQTLRPSRIVVLDNGSTDGTAEVVARYPEVRFLSWDSSHTWRDNVLRAQKLSREESQADWVMVFHDDDVLHPRYLEWAMNAAEKHENVAVIGSSHEEWNGDDAQFRDEFSGHFSLKSVQEFARYLYNFGRFTYSSVLYRRERYAQTQFEFERFGKILDYPFVLTAAQGSEVLIFEEALVKYRIHAGRGSVDIKTGPFLHEVFALNRMYREILCVGTSSLRDRWTFLRRNLQMLLLAKSWTRELREIPIGSFLRTAYQEKAMSLGSLITGLIIKGLKMNYRQEIRQEIKHAVENIVDLAFSLQEKSLSSDQMAQFRARFQSQAVRDAIGGAEASLKGFLAELLNEVQTKNPARFLRWKTIQNTMFVQSPAYIKEELAYLKRSPDWETALRPGLLEDAVGAPAACLYYPKSSGNLIHHTYHLKRFSDWSGQAPSFRRVIFEFGGGYGSFARVWRRHGFKGKYFIYDFAPFNEIQAHYLTELGFRTYVNAEVAEDPEGTYLYSDLSLLEKVMGREPSKSLAIATWSLSESPLSVREKVEPILRRFEQFLFAFQHEFDQVDNLAYFASFAGETIAIPHLPGNSYCFGRGNEHQSK